MEELIWRYLDGECNEEEKQYVAALLQTDKDFKLLYHELDELNNQLSHAAMIPLPAVFKTQLERVVIKEIATTEAPKSFIFPKSLALILFAIAAFVFIYALKVMDTQAVILSFLPEIDDKTMTLVTWVSFGFLLLYAVDMLLKQALTQRKQPGLHVS